MVFLLLCLLATKLLITQPKVEREQNEMIFFLFSATQCSAHLRQRSARSLGPNERSTTTVAAKKCKTAEYFYTRTLTTITSSDIDIWFDILFAGVCVRNGVKAIGVLGASDQRTTSDETNERAGFKRERVNVIARLRVCVCERCIRAACLPIYDIKMHEYDYMQV